MFRFRLLTSARLPSSAERMRLASQYGANS